MSLSPEVQSTVDEIRRNKSLAKSLQAERDLWKQKAMESQARMDAMTRREMSEEDKAALREQTKQLDELNNELEGAAHENVQPEAGGGPVQPVVQPVPPPNDPEAPRPDPIVGTGQNGTVPLMPNSAFNPAGVNQPAPAAGDGQPNQPEAIETAGGFVIAGGGTTQRAPGSRPESPSSSLVIPTDPNAKGPASTADEVKSGLGDSSQNALVGSDLKPVSEGPGVVQEASPAEQEAAQKQQDALNAERARREANPLNLSDEDLAKQKASQPASTPVPPAPSPAA